MKLNMTVQDTQVPAYAHEGDAGLDLRITERTRLLPGMRRTVGTGVSVEIPEGHVGLLFPRSGLSSNLGIALANAVAVIDSGYRGEIRAPLYNISQRPITLNAGERVCQLVIMPFVRVEPTLVESLGDSERGVDGFGSSGRS